MPLPSDTMFTSITLVTTPVTMLMFTLMFMPLRCRRAAMPLRYQRQRYAMPSALLMFFFAAMRAR